MSSRKLKGKAAQQAALKELREFRELGLRRVDVMDSDSDEDMYEYLDEDEYKERKKRLKEEGDFVVDDDGTGYVDNFDDDDEDAAVDGDIGALKRAYGGKDDRAGGKRRKERLDEQEDDGKNQKLSSLFSKIAKTAKRTDAVGPKGAASGSLSKAEKDAEQALQDESLDGMLSDLISGSRSASKKKKRKSLASASAKKAKLRKGGSAAKRRRANHAASDEEDEEDDDNVLVNEEDTSHPKGGGAGDENDDEDDDGSAGGLGDNLASDDEADGAAPTTPKAKADGEAGSEAEADGSAAVKSEPTQADIKAKLLAAARSRPVRALPKPEPTPTTPTKQNPRVTFMSTPPPAAFSAADGDDASGWSANRAATSDADADASAASASSAGTKPSNLPKDASGEEYLDMFYMDMYEDYFNSRGTVFLFGKVWCEEAKQHVSCSVAVRNVERVLHVLPRASLRGDPSTEVKFEDVLNEIRTDVVDKVLPLNDDRSRAFRCRPVELQYAFELPGVPRDSTQYLAVHYPMCAEKFRLEPDMQGETFSHVFGTQQSAIEQFVLARELKGPMWIRLKGIKFPEISLSWCKYHAEVDKPNKVTPLIKALAAEHTNDSASISVPPPPPLRVLSLSLKTVVNEQTHEHEVVMASGLVRDNVDLVGATANAKSSREVKPFTIVRGGKGGIMLPPNFREHCKKAAPHVSVQNNERALLSFLLVQIQRLDPDVILGHNIRQFDLDVLLSRFKANSVNMWSKIGRLRLSKMPSKRADGGGFYSNTNLTAGRLLLDTYTTARELLLGQRSYTLTELCRTQLDRPRTEVQPAQVAYFFQSKELLHKLINFSEADAWLTLQLSFKLEAVPLTLQLSTLAGNIWSRTLAGGRAERIEYLLLHEFYRRGYLLPDKLSARHANKQGGGGNKKGNGDEGKAKSRSASRKPKYDGGLVLEPKKGLYDKFILLLDFNSLYPSIIQEYNICYTTVERTRGADLTEARPAVLEGDGDDDDGEGGSGGVELDEGEVLPPLPDLSVHKELAVLPSLIRTLVERRKTVKRELKSEKDVSKRDQLEVRQKALKITANSMYGCLGFNGFRFFARPVAALVTAQGRSILQNTVDITQDKLGYEVVYGDTDSIMVNTNTTDLELVKQAGKRIKAEINRLYKLLEIEQDGIFKTLLLLKKKKYAALAVKGSRDGPDGPVLVTEKETKGLDLVRRDWCQLSKRVGHTVLDFILSGKSYDDIVEGIHEYLETVQTEIKEGKVKLEEFVITKGLNKAPKDYPDAKSQPHLSVALAMVEAGKPVNTGDHIPYVICRITRKEYQDKLKARAEAEAKAAETAANGGDPAADSAAPAGDAGGGAGADADSAAPAAARTSTSYAERAFHPDEVTGAPDGLLEVDTDWYLKQQIVPPTQRLCEPIDGTSPQQIAQHLGLDPASFQHNYQGSAEDEAQLNIVNLSDAERYKSCERLAITCPGCALRFSFAPGGIALPDDVSRALGTVANARTPDPVQAESGLSCPQCQREIDMTWLGNQLTLAARRAIGSYYEGWLVADDPSVDLRTRQQSILGRTYTLNGRRLQLSPEQPAGELYTQLKYLESLMDMPRATEQLETANLRRKAPIHPPKGIRPSQRDALERLRRGFRSSFVESSAYNWVEPDLFRHAFRLGHSD